VTDPLAGALCVADLRAAAARVADRAAYDYCSGGAGDEEALAGNEAAFRRRRLVPRALRGVTSPAVGLSLLGSELATPVGVAPTSLQRLAHPDGEVASARAAAEVGALFCLSTFASRSLEDVAAASSGPRWYQLYLLRDRGLTRSLVARAVAAGYRAILVTCDQPVSARRRRDVRNGFDRFRAGQPNLALELAASWRAANGGTEEEALRRGLERIDGLFPNPASSWADLEWVCAESSLPVLLKGVLRPEDAREAVRRGAAGVVVSNHGGRQLDRAAATVDVLPAVVDALAGDGVALLDSGVRSGLDAAIALCLGARAVLVGRPVLWGMMASPGDGVAGARRALDLLHGELCEAMTLLGAASLDELDASLVA
jgi:isopentenyl diphosphate isomerase/L-lactate dehydrogenase-like FMN-dependent dehydrogenase